MEAYDVAGNGAMATDNPAVNFLVAEGGAN